MTLEEAEFAQRTEALQPRLYRTALLYLGGEAPAAEAVAETVYRGFLNRKKLRHPEFFSTWMTLILMNVCCDELRRRKRETAREDLPEPAAEDYDPLPLRTAVERLPDEVRAVIVLRYFTGLTLAETAESLGIPPGTVSIRQRKGLALLRLDLEEEGF